MYRWELLRKVLDLSNFNPTRLTRLFRDRRSEAQQCLIRFLSSFNILGFTHAHYTWSLNFTHLFHCIIAQILLIYQYYGGARRYNKNGLVFPLDFLSIISKSNLSNGNPSHNALQVCCGICLPPLRAGKATIGLLSSSSPGQVDLLATVSDKSSWDT